MPTDDPLNPFTEEDFEQMVAALARADDTEKAINKAKRAGIELPGLLEDNRKAATRLRQIIQTYRPGR